MDRAFARRSGGRVPGKGDGVPEGDGRSWALRNALPAVRGESSANPLRRQRDELLCPMPDGRAFAGRPGVLAIAAAGLAALARRTGIAASAPLDRARPVGAH